MAVAMAPGASAATYGPGYGDDGVFVSNIPYVPVALTYTVAGRDPIATAIKLAQTKRWSGHGVILVRNDAFPDALVSGPLADALNVPILVTPRNVLDVRVAEEIAQLAHGHADFKVTIVGGTSAISEGISTFLAKSEGYNVERLRGLDRYDTALTVAQETLEAMHRTGINHMNAFVTTGTLFPDALAAGTAAASDHGVVVLSRGTVPDKDTTDFLKTMDSEVNSWSGKTPELVTAGGWAEIAYPDADLHFSGVDRFETAAMLANYYFGFGITNHRTTNNVAVVSGLNFADAVVAAGFIANADGPLLLTGPKTLNKYTAAYLDAQSDWVDNAFVIGSAGTLSPAINNAVKGLLFNFGWTL
jgi:putative cell wall-binding protein